MGYLVYCFVVSGYAKAFFVCMGANAIRCSHVSILWFGQSVQLGLGYVRGQKMLCWWFPMYWMYQNFKVCVIYAPNMPKAF